MPEPIAPTRMAETGIPARAESIPGLLKDVRDQTTLLLRQEVALAKAEFSEKLTRLLRNGTYLVAGSLAAFAGLIFLLHAVTAAVGLGLNRAGLEEQHSAWLAPLIVALIVIAGSAVCIKKGVSAMKTESLVPEKTLDSLKEDKEWMQSKVS